MDRRVFLKAGGALAAGPLMARPAFARVAPGWSQKLEDRLPGDFRLWSSASPGDDVTPHINRALQAMRLGDGVSQGRGVLVLPPGHFRMASGIDPAALAGNKIIGAGSQATQLMYDGVGGAAIHLSGQGGYSGGEVSGLSIRSLRRNSNAYGLLMRGDQRSQPDQVHIEDVVINGHGDGDWFAGFQAYGDSRSSPAGIRIVNISNLQVFACRSFAAYFSNCVQWTVNNLGAYSPKGPGGGDVHITGGGGAGADTNQFYLTGLSASGALHLNNCSGFYVRGSVGRAQLQPTADYGEVVLSASGGVAGRLGAHSRTTIW